MIERTLHPEIPLASTTQVTPTQTHNGRFFSICVGERHLCPFDQAAITESDFCRTECSWRRRVL